MGRTRNDIQSWRLSPVNLGWVNFHQYRHWKGDVLVIVRGPCARKGQWTRDIVTKYVIEKNGTKRPIRADNLRADENPETWDDPADWWDAL